MNNVPPVQEPRAIEIAKRAEERLRQSPYFYLRNLLCRFDAGVLTITGKVPYWQLRNFAESIVSRVDGVQHVANQVEVIDPQLRSIAAQSLRNAG